MSGGAGTPAPSGGVLRRQLGLGGAVVLGLGSMIGAGIFTAFSPAAGHGAPALLFGLGLAALVAFCNAASSAQLAAQYPGSGGTYLFGRERLGPWPGFLAGWAFVIGKTASCAAMALGLAATVAPPEAQKPVALCVVLLLTALNLGGITRTVAATGLLLLVSLVALGVVLGVGFTGPVAPGMLDGPAPSVHATLQSAAFLFFAFAGYARLATLGEEVKRPARTLPRAILLSLCLVLALYALVAVATLRSLGAAGLAASPTPVLDTVRHGAPGWAVVVQVGAAAAMLGALLALLTGVGRTALAMARNDDLPRPLSAISTRTSVPHRAQITLGLIVCVLVVLTDLRGAIGFSSFGVLLYYLITNVSAMTQERGHRRYPRAVPVLGAVGCVALAFALPLASIAAGLAVLAMGVLYRAVRLRWRGARS